MAASSFLLDSTGILEGQRANFLCGWAWEEAGPLSRQMRGPSGGGEVAPPQGPPPPQGVPQQGTSRRSGCRAGSQIPSPRQWLGATSHSLPCPYSQASCSGPGSRLPSATRWLSSPPPFLPWASSSGAVADSVPKMSVTSSVTPCALIVLSFLTTFSLGEPHFLHIHTSNLESTLN